MLRCVSGECNITKIFFIQNLRRNPVSCVLIQLKSQHGSDLLIHQEGQCTHTHAHAHVVHNDYTRQTYVCPFVWRVGAPGGVAQHKQIRVQTLLSDLLVASSTLRTICFLVRYVHVRTRLNCTLVDVYVSVCLCVCHFVDMCGQYKSGGEFVWSGTSVE